MCSHKTPINKKMCVKSITRLSPTSEFRHSFCSNKEKPACLSEVDTSQEPCFSVTVSFICVLLPLLSPSLSVYPSFCSRGPLCSSRRLITSRALPPFCSHGSTTPCCTCLPSFSSSLLPRISHKGWRS